MFQSSHKTSITKNSSPSINLSPNQTEIEQANPLEGGDFSFSDFKLQSSESPPPPPIQTKGTIGQPPAPSEQLEEQLNNSKNGGSPLPDSTKGTMESHFGQDFSNVKLHTDTNAVQMNRDLQAQAFTHGNDIYFGEGKYNPTSQEGKHLLAHELTHVVQQNGGQSLQKQQLSSNTNSSVINRDPNPSGGDDKPAKLHIHADLDAPGMGLIDQLQSGEVGHAWISLQWKDPNAVPANIHADHQAFLKRGGVQADPMGFWPKMFQDYDPLTDQWSSIPDDQRAGYSSNPFKSYVPGQMVHPDNLHTAKATQSYDITRDQADQVIQYAELKRNSQYSVFFYNCTTFAKQAAEAAGISPPSMGTAGICYPDALYKSIVKNQQKKIGTTSVTDSKGNVTTVEGSTPKKG